MPNDPTNSVRQPISSDELQWIDSIAEGFVASIETEDHASIEEHLSDCPPHLKRPLFGALLSVEVNRMRRAGTTPSISSYLIRFPEYESTILEQVVRSKADSRKSDAHAGEETAAMEQSGTTSIGEQTADVSFDASLSRPAPATDSLGDYELLEVIGRGGMGVVYLARQKKLNRLVALKTILAGQHADDVLLQRFQVEAEAASRLNHAGIVPVYEFGDADGVSFFSMGLIRGASLSDHLRHNNYSPVKAAELLLLLARAVQYAHEAGVVHRDLKPSNILIDKDGTPKISDFGLAKMLDNESVTASGALLGTPSYMSPEQARCDNANIGPACDVYALGAVLFATLCGRPPFRGDSTMDTLRQVMEQRPVSPKVFQPSLPVDLATICLKCLEKEPGSRYASAQDLADELTRFLDGKPIVARPVSSAVRAVRWCKRNPVVTGLMSAVVVAVLAGTFVSAHFWYLANERGTQATRGQREAVSQSQLALKSVKSLIHTVQERLQNVPEARELRRDILQQALKDLESISSGYLEQSVVDRESAVVLLELANVFLQVGGDADSKGIELAERHFRMAVDMYLELRREAPKDVKLRKEMLEAAHAYGNAAREYKHFEQARWAHGQYLKVGRDWFDAEPNNLEAQFVFALGNEALGESMIRSGGRPEGTRLIERSVQLMMDYRNRAPSLLADEKMAFCYCSLGDAQRLNGETKKAGESYQKMVDLSKRLYELEPDNPDRILDRSTDYERVGDLFMQMKDHDGAREAFEKAIEYGQEFVDLDPTNQYKQHELTWGYSKLANVCKLQGDKEREAWARQRLKEIRSVSGE